MNHRAAKQTPKSSIRAALAKRAKVLVVLGAAGLVLGASAPSSAFLQRSLPEPVRLGLDLATHWQWLYLAVLALGLGLLMASAGAGRTSRPWLLAALLLALPFLSASPVLATGNVGGEGTSPVLTVASANVHFENTDAARLLSWLAQVDADVAVVLEVSPGMARALQADTRYPFKKIIAETDPFGIAILSRYPLSDVQVKALAAGPAYLTAELAWHGRKVSLAALHTMPPIVGALARLTRDADIAHVLADVRASGNPAVVAGDFNASAWSAPLHAAGQQGFRRTTSLAPTWPTALAGLAGIPLDQVLASPHWAAAGAQRGPDIGSDHYPVVSRLTLVQSN